MRIWKKTDPGVIRRENQDACGTRSCKGYVLAAVCDGMGGAKAGEVASEMALTAFLDAMEEYVRPGMTQEEIAEAGKNAVAYANTIVYERSQEVAEYLGMGTTLVAVVAEDHRAVAFNVGDSRAYLINSAGITAITRDHSVVQDMLEHGDITIEEARIHPKRNLITRALGTEEKVRCDTFSLDLTEGDHVLLCSDGLVNTVSEQEILYEVIHDENMETCLDRMLEISIDRGAPDNVTMVLLKYVKEAET